MDNVRKIFPVFSSYFAIFTLIQLIDIELNLSNFEITCTKPEKNVYIVDTEHRKNCAVNFYTYSQILGGGASGITV